MAQKRRSSSFRKYLIGGRGFLMRWAENRLNELEYECIKSPENFNFLSGIINGIEESIYLSHKEAINHLLHLKNEINELNTDMGLFDITIKHLEGCLAGIEEVLIQNRHIFQRNYPIFIVVYSENAELLHDLNMVLISSYKLIDSSIDEISEISDSACFFTTSIEEAEKSLKIISKEEFDVSFTCIHVNNGNQIPNFNLGVELSEKISKSSIVIKPGSHTNLKRLSRKLYRNVAFIH